MINLNAPRKPDIFFSKDNIVKVAPVLAAKNKEEKILIKKMFSIPPS